MTPLILPEQMVELVRNARNEDGTEAHDPWPVVKLFTPDANATWLISEADPDDPDLLFGLCDLGVGCPELGNVRLSEIEAVRGGLKLAPERDLYFKAKGPISRYATRAIAAGRIITD